MGDEKALRGCRNQLVSLSKMERRHGLAKSKLAQEHGFRVDRQFPPRLQVFRRKALVQPEWRYANGVTCNEVTTEFFLAWIGNSRLASRPTGRPDKTGRHGLKPR